MISERRKKMGLNDTPSGERVHIGIFGRTNAGKSTVVNAITGQDLSIVSDVSGTTTDPVRKAMELLPLGPVVLIDTPGFDDEGQLGPLRIRKTLQTLRHTDIALLVTDAGDRGSEPEQELVKLFEERKIPYLLVRNKMDLLNSLPDSDENEIYVSALYKDNIHELKERIARLAKREKKEKFILKDLVKAKDLVVLVIPVDSAAPKGRLILPQQQVMREVIELGAWPVAVSPEGIKDLLDSLKKPPALVITDSQVFDLADRAVPDTIPLTSFSILMARYKGFLSACMTGVEAMGKLKDGDRILISEGCTHHRQCEDIGTVKLPAWIRDYTGKKLVFETSSGRDFPEDLSSYAMVIHCGGCMLNEKEMKSRMQEVVSLGIPFTNYGIAIAFLKGILERSIAVLPDLQTCVFETLDNNAID